mgnify:CR=1 FL=1
MLAESAARQLGVAKPRVAVAGLNPHAGESGLFGREDIDIIAPAIAKAQRLGIAASGPWPRLRWRSRAFGPTELAVLTRQLAGLVRSGLPLERALTALTDEAENERQRALERGERFLIIRVFPGNLETVALFELRAQWADKVRVPFTE